MALSEAYMAKSRINEYLESRKGMRGLDPDIIHAVNSQGEIFELRISDIELLIKDRDNLRDEIDWRDFNDRQ